MSNILQNPRLYQMHESLVYFARRTTKLRKALGLKALKKRDNEMHLTKLENLPSSIFHFHSVQLLGRIIPRQICKIEQIQKCQNGWFQFQLNHIFRSFPACIFKSTFPLFVQVQLCLLIHEGLFQIAVLFGEFSASLRGKGHKIYIFEKHVHYKMSKKCKIAIFVEEGRG